MKIQLLAFFASSNKYCESDRKKFSFFIKRENFILRLANGLLNRTIKSIYYRAKVLFNSLKRLKDMSDSEKKLIKNLHSINKNR
jgi:hypothetical protein